MKTPLVILLTILVIVAVACGGGEASSNNGVVSLDEGGDTNGAVDAPELDAETQLLAFAECIRDQGFEVEDPTVDADGNVRLPRGDRPAEGFLEARDACSEHLEGVTLGFRDGDQTARQDSLLEFATCMRDNGFDMADPDFSERGGRGLLQSADQDDPAFQSAFSNCDGILDGARGN